MADLVVPQMGESITEAVVVRWLKQPGEAVAADEAVAELETDKITAQLLSPVAGAMGSQGVAVGATVKIGQVVGTVEAGAKSTAAPAKPKGPEGAIPADSTERPTSRVAKAMPAARAPAGMTDVAAAVGAPPDPKRHYAQVQGGTGNGKQLDKNELLKLTPSQRVHARESGELPRSAPASAAGASPAPPIEARLAQVDPRDEIVPMTPLRKRVAERLVQAQQESASLTTFNEVDMTAILDLRTRYKDSFEKQHGVKLGFMAFFVKACAAACKLFPGVNAEVIGGNIVYKKHYDFGIAVSAPKGLVVPVLRDVDSLSFAGIEKGIVDLATRARDGKLAMPDLTGGTFSITNGGIFGSMMSTPLLNYPQTGILGMHNIVKRAVVVNDAVTVRPMMYVALSYDHRVVDGREAVSFLVAVKERLEAPERLMLEA
jgi:2-oxoglutarate dehydrogenase E2 component (dihydrolipoamide succinyltransferase)